MLAAVKNILFPTRDGARCRGLTHACVCLALFCAWWMPPADAVKVERARLRLSESALDAALLRVAGDALGSRDGTIIVADAQTGRIRAAVNPRLAEEAAFPPGSAIKPFTLLTALRAGIIKADSRLSCRRHYERHGADFNCSHPVYIPPFNPAQALAHSCNYYFARLAERLPPAEFNHTLAAYAFGARATATAATVKRASAYADAPAKGAAAMPRLPRGNPQVETALGEGGELLVTPLQLVAAYAALFNGGHLYRTQPGAHESFRGEETARLDITPGERTLLLSSLRGAVRYGTAAPADLASLPTHVFGKTGTATDESDGSHTHGWFVGLASEREAHASASPVASQWDAPAPAEVKLVVLVFLKRGQGKESAAVARAVFAEHARLTMDGNANSGSRGNTSTGSEAADFANAPRASTGAPLVRVRLSREEATRTLPLDEYLFGALAAEASVEDEFAALKAQAVVSRTYALSNLRRHARDNYDFCDTTHCQRFIGITQATARPDFHALVRRAIADTGGEVLRGSRGSLASDVFFSASCGGQTANLQALWGSPARAPYLRGVRDEYCAAMPHTRWTDAIPAARLAVALREDSRTDVGARVAGLTVVKRDATGRVEQLAIAGDRRRVVVRGWDFKIVVGRTLGWSVLKSSRFDVMRAGDKFVFRGSGFGHGLGLCQNGAHVMASRGASYRQILAHYFPGTTVGGAGIATPIGGAGIGMATPVGGAGAATYGSGAATATSVGRAGTAIPAGGAVATEPKAAPRTETQARRASPESHEKAAIGNFAGRVETPARAPVIRESFARPRGIGASFARPRGIGASFATPRPVQASFVRSGVARARPIQASFAHANFTHTRDGHARREFAHAAFEASPVAVTASLAQVRLSLSSENFRVSYPARGASRREVEAALAVLEAARADVRSRLAAASVAAPALGVLEVFVHPTTGDFTGATGKPAWVAAVTRGRRIDLQPLATLGRRGLLAPTLRHEYAHAVIDAVSRSRAPLWLSEGLAAHVAGEGRMLTHGVPQGKLSREELEKRLAAPANAADMRALYAAAFREVSALIRAQGEADVWRRVARG
ncbi:MAG TPA: SpoIID/LytB domain-containing protein [Pyrinomonadaceae bacterium]|nr:SpoIID/LytB domain-containing protein [Pyrinomonadaceae bacterium]